VSERKRKGTGQNMVLPLPLPLPSGHGHPYEAIGRTALDGGRRGSREADTTRRRWGSIRATLLCGAALCSVGLWVTARRDGGSSGRLGMPSEPLQLSSLGGRSGGGGRTAAEDLGSDAVMQVLVTNKYQRDGSSLERLYPWEHVAEPVRETRLEIFSWPGREQGDAAGKLEFM